VLLPDGDDLLGMTAHNPSDAATVSTDPCSTSCVSFCPVFCVHFHVSQRAAKGDFGTCDPVFSAQGTLSRLHATDHCRLLSVTILEGVEGMK
jgi:hypothetical protein